MTLVEVKAGICGFSALVSADRVDRKEIRIQIDSDCDKVQALGKSLLSVELNDVFKRPFNTNKIYEKAGQCCLHYSCPVPCAVLKATEVELKLALKENVQISFKTNAE